MKDLKVVFMGTPEFAVPVLKMLHESVNLVGVVSKVDAPFGRKKVLTPSSVSLYALENNIKLLRIKSIKEEYEEILKLEPELIVTCAYGQIVPKEVLDYPKYGCINVHASLLPKYRGASPINQVIKNGENKTGITIMYMDEGLDTGDIIAKREVEIKKDETFGELSSKLSLIGPNLLKEVILDMLNGNITREKQNEDEATYVGMLKRSDEILNFDDKAINVYNHIRSLIPTPYAGVLINGEEWKIIDASYELKKMNIKPGIINDITKSSFSISCLDGNIVVKAVKRPGKNAMEVKDLFNGYKKELLEDLEVGVYEKE